MTESAEEGVRILLVDDHAVMREALVSAFEQEADLEIVGQAGSLAEARLRLGEAEHLAVVVLIDLGLPDSDGSNLIPDLREANPKAEDSEGTHPPTRSRCPMSPWCI
jgi:DNA-binding NarL/FixJ family response regulator